MDLNIGKFNVLTWEGFGITEESGYRYLFSFESSTYIGKNYLEPDEPGSQEMAYA